ncbi:30S ribosomal protein S27ae [Candidatus Woesearchaeota archaeon]|nr:30S ribosomal protein S27ae [Candidatus Woesearchaeota archaeon]
MADKKPVKKGALRGVWNNYEKKSDSVTLKNKSCPKCGQGYLLAAHANRLTCGKCHYVEFVVKK